MVRQGRDGDRRSTAGRSRSRPTTLTPWSSRSSSGHGDQAQHEGDQRRRGSCARSRAARGSGRGRSGRPRACTGWCPGARRPAGRSCSGTEPPLDGTPRSLGSWPTMIVIASPKMNPVTTDLVRKSAMNPSLAIPPAASSRPTVSASAEVSTIDQRRVAAGEIDHHGGRHDRHRRADGDLEVAAGAEHRVHRQRGERGGQAELRRARPPGPRRRGRPAP